MTVKSTKKLPCLWSLNRRWRQKRSPRWQISMILWYEGELTSWKKNISTLISTKNVVCSIPCSATYIQHVLTLCYNSPRHEKHLASHTIVWNTCTSCLIYTCCPLTPNTQEGLTVDNRSKSTGEIVFYYKENYLLDLFLEFLFRKVTAKFGFGFQGKIKHRISIKSLIETIKQIHQWIYKQHPCNILKTHKVCRLTKRLAKKDRMPDKNNYQNEDTTVGNLNLRRQTRRKTSLISLTKA